MWVGGCKGGCKGADFVSGTKCQGRGDAVQALHGDVRLCARRLWLWGGGGGRGAHGCVADPGSCFLPFVCSSSHWRIGHAFNRRHGDPKAVGGAAPPDLWRSPSRCLPRGRKCEPCVHVGSWKGWWWEGGGGGFPWRNQFPPPPRHILDQHLPAMSGNYDGGRPDPQSLRQDFYPTQPRVRAGQSPVALPPFQAPTYAVCGGGRRGHPRRFASSLSEIRAFGGGAAGVRLLTAPLFSPRTGAHTACCSPLLVGRVGEHRVGTRQVIPVRVAVVLASLPSRSGVVSWVPRPPRPVTLPSPPPTTATSPWISAPRTAMTCWRTFSRRPCPRLRCAVEAPRRPRPTPIPSRGNRWGVWADAPPAPSPCACPCPHGVLGPTTALSCRWQCLHGTVGARVTAGLLRVARQLAVV